MRGICLVVALLGVPAIAAAQQTIHASAGMAPAPGRTGSLGPIGLPLPSIGLPLPSIGSSPRQPIADPRRAAPGHQRGENQRGGNQRGESQRGGQRRDGEWIPGQTLNKDVSQRPRSYYEQSRHQRKGPALVYVGPQYGYPYYGGTSPGYYETPGMITQATTVPGVITVVPEPLSGVLLLEVEPADILQVFVDGEYVGTPADLGGALDLQPGSRRIEFRAPGHRTLTIDAQIVSQRTIVYRATLERIAPTRVVPPPAAPIAPPAPMPSPAVPSGNRTMYLIPGCYMGNVPPQDLKLPAGCDLSRLTTLKP